jgi:hypothetical protein
MRPEPGRRHGSPALTIRPIFLFSLPRTGSTLVQRVLATHPEVDTVSEPWLLLPLLYGLREEGARAEYWHVTAAQAIGDFTRELPNGRDDYLDEVRRLALNLYGKAAQPGATYFIDKTPHYHLIAGQLIQLFPDARFIFLWRDPLSVVSSLIDSLRGGRWEPEHFRIDLRNGLTNLTDAFERNAGRCCAVRYEDLLGQEPGWERLFDYLDLTFRPDLVGNFAEVQLKGRYGDRAGLRRYSSFSDEPLGKWQHALRGAVRRDWMRRYLIEIGEHRLAVMGYSLEESLKRVDSLPARPTTIPRDMAALWRSKTAAKLRERALRLPETPHPRGEGFLPPPPLASRGLARLRNAGRRLKGASSEP